MCMCNFLKKQKPSGIFQNESAGSNLRATETEADTIFRLTGLVFLLLGSKWFIW